MRLAVLAGTILAGMTAMDIAVLLELVLYLFAINLKQILMLYQLAVLAEELQVIMLMAAVEQAAAELVFAILRQVNC